MQSMHLMLLGSSVADDSYEERNTDHTTDTPIRLSKETARKGAHTAVGGMKTLVHKKLQSREKERLQESQRRNRHRLFDREQKQEHRQENLW